MGRVKESIPTAHTKKSNSQALLRYMAVRNAQSSIPGHLSRAAPWFLSSTPYCGEILQPLLPPSKITRLCLSLAASQLKSATFPTAISMGKKAMPKPNAAHARQQKYGASGEFSDILVPHTF